MIEIMPASKGKILAVTASGKVTQQDYKDVLIPQLEAIIDELGKARFLCYLGEDFQGIELGAIWEDTKFGLKHRADFEKMALVGPTKWMELVTKLFAPLVKGEIKNFPREELDQALNWINA